MEKKDTIYIDVDDEITSIIEKVRSSPQKIVALVLPKRAATLQSIVNLKLLKRSSEEAKKHLVLITSEAALMPLAGAVGLYVAKTLLTKPIVPPAPPDPDSLPDNPAEDISETDEQPLDGTKPVGVLAGLPASDEEETIEVDNDEPGAAVAAKKSKKPKPPKGLKIPNFNKFRTKILLAGGLGVLLLIGLYLANFVMPAAEVVVKTDTETINTSLSFISSPGAQEFDMESDVVPASTKELKKSDGQKASATGQKNVGEKAKGKAVFYNCNLLDLVTSKNHELPAGTSITSGNLTFILSESVEVPPSTHSDLSGTKCKRDRPSESVDVVAQNPGDAYNVSSRNYSVNGFASMSAKGTDMSGGTNEMVRIVSQQDIDGLRQKIVDELSNNAKEELKQQLIAEGFIALEDTFQVGEPVAVSSPNVNTEANEVTANVTMAFTMQGIKEDNVTVLIDKELADNIDTDRQTISNYGLDDAVFQIGERRPNGDVSYTLKTLVIAGPEIDEEAIKQEIAGKKEGEAENLLKARPGVREVSVRYSPFWVTKAPNKSEKISVTIESIEITPADDENSEE